MIKRKCSSIFEEKKKKGQYLNNFGVTKE